MQSFFVQVDKNILNDCRILDTDNDPDVTTAFATGFDVNKVN